MKCNVFLNRFKTLVGAGEGQGEGSRFVVYIEKRGDAGGGQKW